MKADDATQRREQATSEPAGLEQAGLEQAGLEMENFVIHDIIWDAGGTLFDTYPAMTQAFDAALREFGAQIPLERILQLARESTHYAISTLAHETGIDADALESAFRRRYNAIGPEAQPPFPGVKEVCAAICARGGRNFIVTHRGRDSLNALLAAHGMEAYFSDSITAEDPFPRKPDPTALNALAPACLKPAPIRRPRQSRPIWSSPRSRHCWNDCHQLQIFPTPPGRTPPFDGSASPFRRMATISTPAAERRGADWQCAARKC